MRWTDASTVGRLIILMHVCLNYVDANAFWKETTDGIEGSAYNLREGELTIGVFSPLQYGVSDRIMLRIHPVLGLFLTPNLGAQVELIEGPWRSLLQEVICRPS